MLTDSRMYYHKVVSLVQIINENVKNRPSIQQLGAMTKLSVFELDLLFRKWIGLTLEQYVNEIHLNYKKRLAKQETACLRKESHDGDDYQSYNVYQQRFRLSIAHMTEEEYKNMSINYECSSSVFGDFIIAATPRGICYLAFIENKLLALAQLKKYFPLANFEARIDEKLNDALAIIHQLDAPQKNIQFHLRGTSFQLKVWQSLLFIPFGTLTTYGTIAASIGDGKASRAVGNAIGWNPIAYFIPCHRVIPASGNIGGYRWCPIRKQLMIAWEAALSIP